jgi:hypothetical protein
MDQEDGDPPDSILQPSSISSDLQSLKDLITLTLCLLIDKNLLDEKTKTLAPESCTQLVYPGTEHATQRQMWLIESTDSSEIWLDETGEGWPIDPKSPDYAKPINLDIQDVVALSRGKTLLLKFMTRLSQPS